MNLVISGLARHDHRDFDCGEPALNIFLQRLARQQADRDHQAPSMWPRHPVSRASVVFYAFSSSSVNFENWPADFKTAALSDAGGAPWAFGC